MTTFLQLLLVGIVSGAVFGLIATGFAVIYKCGGIFNLAQGEFVALGAYITLMLLNGLGLHPAFAISLAVVAGFIVGIVLSFFPIRPLLGQSMFALFIVTLGLMVFLKGIIIIIWASKELDFFRPFISQNVFRFGDISLYPRDILALALVAAVLLGLLLLFRYTRVGLVMRAASEDMRIASSLGIDLKVVTAIALGIGAAVAVLGGLILGLNGGIYVNIGDAALVGLAAVLVGGMDSIPGAVVGGLFIGIVGTMASFYIGHGIGDTAIFIAMIGVLLIRPYGFFGQRRIERV